MKSFARRANEHHCTPLPRRRSTASGWRFSITRAARRRCAPAAATTPSRSASSSAFYELGVEPWKVAKFSGIGCSSKSPAYFLGMSHGFNCGPRPHAGDRDRRHARQPHLLGLGVTGDGDTASIGLGQFMHLLRRNLPLIYMIENNGVYGLTKGQFSATADVGSTAEDRRPQRPAAVRLLRAGHRSGAPHSSRGPSAATRSSFRPS